MENGSPELKFFPENDLDDCTNAVIEIHPMLVDEVKTANIKSNKVNINDAETDIGTAEDATDPETLILELIRSNPKITIIQISEKIGALSVSGVRYHIKALKDRGILSRKGSTKAGEWVVADVNPNVEQVLRLFYAHYNQKTHLSPLSPA